VGIRKAVTVKPKKNSSKNKRSEWKSSSKKFEPELKQYGQDSIDGFQADLKKGLKEQDLVIAKAERSDAKKTFVIPTYTDQELAYFEDGWAASIAGKVIDLLMSFTVAGGIKPTFKLKETTKENGEDKTQEEMDKELEEFNHILDDLMKLDENVDFNTKLLNAARMAKVFGRCAILFEAFGEEQDKAPSALKVLHPRNTGRVFINDEDWKLSSLISLIPSGVIQPNEMVYLVNKPDSPIRNTQWFGYSEMQRVIGAARAWRRIIEFDMPEIATSMWAGYGMFLIKKMGRSESDAKADLDGVLDSLKPGSFSAVTVDEMDEIDFKPIDLEPKVGELVELVQFYSNMIIGNFGVPAALLGDESEPNRATLIGKLKMFLEGPVKEERQWLKDIVEREWYREMIVKKGYQDILKKVTVEAEFEELGIEQWQDLVDSVLKLQGLVEVPLEQKLQLLNLEQMKEEVKDVKPEQITGQDPGSVATKEITKTMSQSLDESETSSAETYVVEQGNKKYKITRK
jgi:hypothetical protein